MTEQEERKSRYFPPIGLLNNDFATSAPPKLKDYPLAWLLKRVSQLFERLSPVQWVKQFMKDKIGGAVDKLDKYIL